MIIIIRNVFIRIVLYKHRFDGYVTNTVYIMMRIVLNRREVSGQDQRIHASKASISYRVGWFCGGGGEWWISWRGMGSQVPGGNGG
jgi:hypothetical protein